MKITYILLLALLLIASTSAFRIRTDTGSKYFTPYDPRTWSIAYQSDSKILISHIFLVIF